MKIMHVIRQMTLVEKRKCKKFLQSPYFNTRQDVIGLFDYLCAWPDEAPIDKEKAWLSFATGQVFVARELHLVSNYLFRLVEQFLIQENLSGQPITQTWLLLDSYKKRDLTGHYADTLREAERMHREDTLRNADYFEWGYRIHFEKYYAESTAPISDEQPVQEMFDRLDQAWAARKLRQITLLLNRKKLYQSDLKVAYLSEVIAYAAATSLDTQPVIAAYYYAYGMLTDAAASEQYFHQLKTVLLAHPQAFALQELRELHLFALNFCVRQINASQKNYFGEALSLYQAGLMQSTLLENGHLSRFTYHNIVASGLQCKEFEWVEQFMHQYKNKLERTHRESTFSFNAAKLAYSKDKLQEALGLLQNANYRDILLNLPAKALSAKIYYELGESEVLQSHLTAMQTFIYRKRVIGYHKDNFLNFIKYTNKLIGTNRYDKPALAALRQQIEAEEPLTEKEWLLAQVERMGRR